jgi:hypothetical protein
MFNSSIREIDCAECCAAIEDRLQDGIASIEPGSALASHLSACVACQEALEDAVLSSKLMRVALETAPAPSAPFVTRVMASVREAADAEQTPVSIWRPLELLASRFALVAAAVLLALSLYLAEFAPARQAGGTSQAEIGAGMPEPPAAPPSNQDDVLISLSEMPNGN